jgi:predicted ATPase
MKAKTLIIKKLYGYLNKKIDFKDNINLLVGINGSGKTSILNTVNWLLTPSLPHLCVTEFESLELLFEYNNTEYTIKVTQDSKLLTYKIKNITQEIEYYPLTVRLKIPTSKLTQNESQKERYYSEYLGLGPDKEETETWALVFNQLPKPIVIGLDRYLFTEEKNEVVLYQDEVFQRLVKKEISGRVSPLNEVRRLANQEYSIYKSKIVELSRDLNNKIILSAFDEITIDTLKELENASNISLEQIENLHKKVETFFKETMSESKLQRQSKRKDSSLKKIENYFNHLKKLIVKAEKGNDKEKFSLLYLSNISQFKKLKDLIKEFEVFERKSQDYYSDIKTYLDTVNNFLTDSAKQLSFQKDLSELIFNVLDKDGKILSKNRDIKTLSSGERQILILFTYLKFHNKSGTIFLIDEPELSLHPKWQEDFLKAVETLTPKNTQIIIATHSPIIVGSNEDYCKVLLPYNG